VSTNGDTVVVGTSFPANNQITSAYIYNGCKPFSNTCNDDNRVTLARSDGSNFGSSVAITESKVVVGADAFKNAISKSYSGAAYVYQYSESSTGTFLMYAQTHT